MVDVVPGTHGEGEDSQTVPRFLRDRGASRHLQLPDLSNSGNLVRTERLKQVLQVILQIIKAVALSPVVRVIIQVTQVAAVIFFPIGEARFHEYSLAKRKRHREHGFLWPRGSTFS